MLRRKTDTDRAAAPAVHCFCWITTLVLISFAHLAAAAQPFNYDLDSLAFRSDDVVEGRIAGQKLRVTAVYAGDLRAGQVVDVDYFYSYVTATRSSIAAQINTDDRLFLFLSKGYNLWPQDSGVAIIRRGRVYRFLQPRRGSAFLAQLQESPDSDDVTSVTQFRAMIQASVLRAARWKTKFAQATARSDVPWLLALLNERALSRRNSKRDLRDAIDDEIADRLVALGDQRAVEEALVMSSTGAYTLARSLSTPQGFDYTYHRLIQPGLPLANRLALLKGFEFSPGATRPATDPEFGPVNYYPRLIELINANASNESVETTLLEDIGGTAWVATTGGQSPPELQLVAKALQDLYRRPDLSDSLRYSIEAALSNFGQAQLAQIGTKCGPIPSRAIDVDLNANPALSPATIVFGYQFVIPDWLNQIPTLDVVIESVPSRQQIVLPSTTVLRRTGLSNRGTEFVPLPQGLTPGQYRLFYRFLNGAQIVGESHYLETTLPQPIVVSNPVVSKSSTSALTSLSLFLQKVFVPTAILAAFSLTVYLVLTIRRRRKRFRDGICICCGYDLRASTVRCPECEAPLPQRLDSSWWTRPVLRILAVVATTIQITTPILWVRSYFACDCISLVSSPLRGSIYSTRGKLVIEKGGTVGSDLIAYEHGRPADYPRSADEAGASRGFHCAGFELSPDANLVVLPCWLVILSSGVVLIWVVKQHARRRSLAGGGHRQVAL